MMRKNILCALTTMLVSTTVAAFAETLNRESNFSFTLSTSVATPHVKWAKPLPGGPVRALFVIHVSGQPAGHRRTDAAV